MPSLQGRFFNALVRRFIRRRYGDDTQALAKKARRLWGAPKIYQWYQTRGLAVQTVDEKGVRGEWLASANNSGGTIFYIHGGGFVACSARTHRPITATLARLTNFRVFGLDYRLAPEAPFPAALDDAFAAYRRLLAQNIAPARIALAGDSAGGGLALALLLRLRDADLPLPACAVCFSPWTDLTGSGESARTNAYSDAMFRPQNTREFAAAYIAEESAAKNPFVSPVFGDFHDLPPVLFHVGSTESLLDDSRRVHQKIRRAGGTSELEIYDDIFHGWQMMLGFVPEAFDSLQKAALFIEKYVSTTGKR